MTWNDMPKRWYDDYERGRPSYPRAAIDVAGLPTTATVIDLGAGTGKLTRVLVSTFSRVVAIEPDDEMRRILVELCPKAETLGGCAEEIPLGDASVDAVFAAQAFHWFDKDRGLAEIARVLRPHGTLVVMWNAQAGTPEPSITTIERLLDRHWPEGWDPLDLGPSRYSRDIWQLVFAQSPFEDPQEIRLANPQTADAEGLSAFLRSMGWICALPDDERIPLMDRARSLLTAPEYVLPWETHIYRTRLRR